jgi:hypothetical protein
VDFEAILILEILHVNPGHVSQDLNDGDLYRHHGASFVNELIDADPVAILEPFFELGEIGVLGVFSGNDDVGD